MCLYVGGGSRRRSERDWPVMRASNIINISYNFVTCNYYCNYYCNVFFLFYKFKQCTRGLSYICNGSDLINRS